MSRKVKDKGRITGPFVPMLVDTMASPAWRALSPYARVVYIALKSHYSPNARNNGRIYLSARGGAEDTGFDMKTVARALRELKHYGFVVMTEHGCLGVEGKGKAPHWRLTELGYMHDPPTKEFMKWDGELFHEQKSPKHYPRKKQNPVPSDGTECTAGRNIPVYRQTEQSGQEVYRRTVHTDEQACTVQRHISRYNHSPIPGWSVPALTELDRGGCWTEIDRGEIDAAKTRPCETAAETYQLTADSSCVGTA